MPQKPSSKDRSGYEYYTKKETVEKLIREYGGIFQDYTLIWLPFNSKGRPIEEVLVKWGHKIITTPDSCYNDELGCNDYWKWKNDKEFYSTIKRNKTLVFDNPPFKGATAIMRDLTENNIDYILFSDAMTGLNKTTTLGCGYHILGNVAFDNAGEDKRINIALFSNFFKEIKYVFKVGVDKRDNFGIDKWSNRCNLLKYIYERNGEISSAELINVCARGYKFLLKHITGKGQKFGGSIIYDFPEKYEYPENSEFPDIFDFPEIYKYRDIYK